MTRSSGKAKLAICILSSWIIACVMFIGTGIVSATIAYNMIDLGTLGGAYSNAYGINDAGQIVGNAYTASGQNHAFLYSDGNMTDLGTLGGAYSNAYGINDAGQIVGMAYTASGQNHAFLYSDGNMTDLGTLGGANSLAWGINDATHILHLERYTLYSGIRLSQQLPFPYHRPYFFLVSISYVWLGLPVLREERKSERINLIPIQARA
jgi:probable HAF family extracellular repeat protein